MYDAFLGCLETINVLKDRSGEHTHEFSLLNTESQDDDYSGNQGEGNADFRSLRELPTTAGIGKPFFRGWFGLRTFVDVGHFGRSLLLGNHEQSPPCRLSAGFHDVSGDEKGAG